VLRLLNERWQEFEPKLRKWLAEIDATPNKADRQRLQMRVDSELEQFVKTQVLTLRACDPAMGSGHFLVHIAHQMTNFILWVLAQTPWSNPAINLDADLWRKRIVENCLYGVDINLMAVELAKLSLWLATMQLGQPLSFLDHHLKQGNSLLGVRLIEILAVLAHSDLTKNTSKSRVAEENGQYGFKTLPQAVQTIQNANEWLEKITYQVVTRTEDIKAQEYDYEEAQRLLAPYKKIGDLLIAQKMGLKINDNEIAMIAHAIETSTIPQLSPEYHEMLQKSDAMLASQCTVHWELEFSHVFGVSNEYSGFNVIIGNPPFLGGAKISNEINGGFLKLLKITYPPTGGQADLCAYFFRLGFNIIQESSCLGMVSTNTISQGDTRRTGLSPILTQGGSIYFAERFVKWGGDANVEVNLLALEKKTINQISKESAIYLDGIKVPFISSWLNDLSEIEPFKLAQNNHKSFYGELVRGIGFVISYEEANYLIEKSHKNQDCLRPYLNGHDINNNFEHKASRMVICFEDWPYEKAKQYPDLLSIAEERVKPERLKLPPITSDYRKLRDRWWQFARFGLDMRKAAVSMNRVLIRSRVSEYNMLAFVNRGQVYSDATVVFAYDDYYHFALLQSYAHDVWLRRQASTMRTDIRYTPTDCFQTFPFPQTVETSEVSQAEMAGHAFYEYRQKIMRSRQLGLTKLYNLFNNPACQDADIIEMRNLNAKMDEYVLACYDWLDIDLRHDFYPNDRKKIRFTPAPEAQREIFSRLIVLNQQIAAQEAAQGLIVEPGEEDESENEAEA
jgi:hypothetical protein